MDTIIRQARVYMVVKAYPQPSSSYEELVCCAGLLDGEKWVRIYPVPFRFMKEEQQFPKHSWITLDLERKHKSDFRPESYRPLHGIQEEIKVSNHDEPTFSGWYNRKRIVLNEVFTSMDQVINLSRPPTCKSLAVVKPKSIIRVTATPCPREWDKAILSKAQELQLFGPEEGGIDISRKIVRKIPYTFSYEFYTEDSKKRCMLIEDWELGALYWNCISRAHGDEKIAVEKVKQKYEEKARTQDVYLIVGTTLKFHVMHPENPFVIIGVFSPPKDGNLSLF